MVRITALPLSCTQLSHPSIRSSPFFLCFFLLLVRRVEAVRALLLRDGSPLGGRKGLCLERKGGGEKATISLCALIFLVPFPWGSGWRTGTFKRASGVLLYPPLQPLPLGQREGGGWAVFNIYCCLVPGLGVVPGFQDPRSSSQLPTVPLGASGVQEVRPILPFMTGQACGSVTSAPSPCPLPWLTRFLFLLAGRDSSMSVHPF